MEGAKDFHQRCFLDLRSNATFVTLILEKKGAKKIAKFRLVSLVGSMSKIKEDGWLVKVECLQLNLATISLILPKIWASLGNPYGIT